MARGCAGTWGASTGEGHQSSILPSWEGSGRGPWVGTAGPGRQRLLSGRAWVSIINTGAIPISGRGGHGPKAGAWEIVDGIGGGCQGSSRVVHQSFTVTVNNALKHGFGMIV